MTTHDTNLAKAPTIFLKVTHSLFIYRHSLLVFSPRGVTVFSLLTSTVLFAIIWAITNYVYARALMNIAATDVTALFSSAPAFVFLFSICVLREPPLVLRVCTCIRVLYMYISFLTQLANASFYYIRYTYYVRVDLVINTW